MPLPRVSLPPFHLAFPVDDLEQARAFYVGVLGCREGRSSDVWIDFDLFGHQIVAHQVARPAAHRDAEHENEVDGHGVPIPHFGLVLTIEAFESLVARIRRADVDVEPYTRFEGQPGEQRTAFLRDPAGNAIELKAFRDPEKLFATS